MPKLPAIKPRDIEKVLLKEGFLPRTTKSSHVVFSHPDGRRTVVPGHSRPVWTGTLRVIIKQAGMSVEEFLTVLKG